jgi:hypothetical protein
MPMLNDFMELISIVGSRIILVGNFRIEKFTEEFIFGVKLQKARLPF